MKCPFCGSMKTKVIDKRAISNGEINRRRRKCLTCNKRFTTYERIEEANILVIKKDGRKEPFVKEKLKIGIVKACEKRPISMEQIDKIVDDIERRIRRYKSMNIKSSVIGGMVTKKLKAVDKIAYLRFTSVYKSFKNPKDFENELKLLKR